MKKHIALFQFHLRNGQSVGPDQLRKLWASACESTDVSVTRQTRSIGDQTSDLYSLCGSPSMPDLPAVERRLRKLLDHAGLNTVVTTLHH